VDAQWTAGRPTIVAIAKKKILGSTSRRRAPGLRVSESVEEGACGLDRKLIGAVEEMLVTGDEDGAFLLGERE
jgi:hypothetical protein